MARDEMDELDDMLDDGRAELEARFRELEQEAEIDAMRQRAGQPPHSSNAQPRSSDQGSSPESADPLANMKAALDSEGELERFLIVICPNCQAKNRMSLSRVRTALPLCGRCKEDLSFVRVNSPQ